MKNSIFILVLCVIASGCATSGDTSDAPATLLSFEEIGNEITVRYESLADDGMAQETLDTTVAGTR